MIMSKPFRNILLIDTIHPCFIEELSAAGFTFVEGYKMGREDVLQSIHLYDGIAIRSRMKLDKEILDKAVHLKFIARAGVGMENIDVAYAESKNIKCLHAPEGNRDAVGEHVVGMLLSLFNNLNKADREVREGKWIREGNRGIELMGKTIGIIGYGNMGMALAKRLLGFDVHAIAYDKYKSGFSDSFAKEVTLEEIFELSDVISLHLPITEETANMVNDSFIQKFKKNIYIVNTARGKILNTHDLVESIKQGKVLGACLDVLEYESLSFENLSPKDFPEPFQYLIKSDKVLLTPHIAGWTHESNVKIAMVLVEKIKGLFLG